MYHLINENAKVVVDTAERLQIDAHHKLRADLKAIDPSSDEDFQRRYRAYWRMNVGRFGQDFYSRYFEILRDCQQSGLSDVRSIIGQLSDIGAASRGLQFSFATKLAHMTDPHVPVYDSYVAAFYFYSPPSSKVSVVSGALTSTRSFDA